MNTETKNETPLVTPRQLEILRHALGLSRGSREYRNHYCPGGEDCAECVQLEAAGLMEGYELAWVQGKTYRVTDAVAVFPARIGDRR